MSNKDIILVLKFMGSLRRHQYGGFSPMRSQRPHGYWIERVVDCYQSGK